MYQREKIIETIIETLRPLPHVKACWQGGAAAFNRVDAWSDIDVNCDVEDEKANEVMALMEQTLEKNFGIDMKFEIAQPGWPGIVQTFFRLKNTSPFLLIDFVVVKHSSKDKFLEPEIHGKAIVHFDKEEITKVAPANREELKKKLLERIKMHQKRFDIFQVLVEKELMRKNFIEAINFYFGYTVYPVVEMLRIRYSIYHWNFASRYIQYDLPQDVVDVIEQFYFVKDGEELKQKWELARHVFSRAVQNAIQSLEK